MVGSFPSGENIWLTARNQPTASYGSLARFDDVKRLRVFAGSSVVGFGGDISDMQYLDRHLNELAIDEAYGHPGEEAEEAEGAKKSTTTLTAANLHTYLTKLMYKRRNDFDPLWNHILVAGVDADAAPFLASVDLRGTAFTAPSLATGFGAALAQPIMRRFADTESQAAELTRERAVEIIKECMKVLYYRDARSLDRYSLAVVTKDGVELDEDVALEKQSWAFAERIKGYGTQTV